MQYSKAAVVNGKMVITSTKHIDQSMLTAECWLIQFDGLSACQDCKALNTPDCGGQAIRKRLMKD